MDGMMSEWMNYFISQYYQLQAGYQKGEPIKAGHLW